MPSRSSPVGVGSGSPAVGGAGTFSSPVGPQCCARTGVPACGSRALDYVPALMPEGAWFVIMRTVFMDREERLMWSDHPNEECGVFGIYAPGEDVARLTFFGLYALQHRGQESAGIATGDGTDLHLYREMGLVNQVFTEERLEGLRGHIAVGHTRYSTTGS